MTTIFSILNILVTGVMVNDNKHIEERLERYRKTNETYYPFYKQKD
ncbi:hypothetical protein GCM10010965_32560 [Caldalkalibacillus thermarum]|nr:hypothetical protein GCM10010965_32560 [Caldalkalibacillus thermarum]